ncbi:MAG: hypothetical protein KDD22_07495 [Bdellovibrionales bacterium]|nr:hypothetical protein [Bdellovibrionales bacterium]
MRVNSKSRQSLQIFWAWGSAGFGILGLMMQFQNCAPSGPQNSLSVDDSSEVRVVDDWSQKPLAFPESVIQLHDGTKNFIAQGVCPRKDEDDLHWSLLDGANTMASGVSVCEMGGFQVEIAGVDQMKCGESFMLEVINEKGDEARTLLSRKCPPILAQENYSSKAGGESCFYELDRSPYSIEPVCYEACYRDEKLAYRERTDSNRCGQQVSGL